MFGDGFPAQPQLPMRGALRPPLILLLWLLLIMFAVDAINDNAGDNNGNNVEQAKCNGMQPTLS